MATVLPGFTFDSRAARYRDTSRGQFVSRARIRELMEQQVNSAEDRLGRIIQEMHAKEITPGYAQVLMRDELRRLSLQNAALGRGGFDRLDFRDYGRVGRQLRDSYQRMSNLLRDVESGKVSLAQALNRVEGYTLDARRHFFASEREATRQSGRVMEAHRVLHARESCGDCIRLASMGWQAAESVPLPGEGGTKCGSYCRCSIEYREVTPEMMRERMTRQLERMMA